MKAEAGALTPPTMSMTRIRMVLSPGSSSSPVGYTSRLGTVNVWPTIFTRFGSETKAAPLTDTWMSAVSVAMVPSRMTSVSLVV